MVIYFWFLWMLNLKVWNCILSAIRQRFMRKLFICCLSLVVYCLKIDQRSWCCTFGYEASGVLPKLLLQQEEQDKQRQTAQTEEEWTVTMATPYTISSTRITIPHSRGRQCRETLISQESDGQKRRWCQDLMVFTLYSVSFQHQMQVVSPLGHTPWIYKQRWRNTRCGWYISVCHCDGQRYITEKNTDLWLCCVWKKSLLWLHLIRSTFSDPYFNTFVLILCFHKTTHQICWRVRTHRAL